MLIGKKKNNKQKGFIPILIAVIVSILVTSGAGYGIYKYNEIKKENTELKEEVTIKPDEKKGPENKELQKEEKPTEIETSQAEVKKVASTSIIEKIDHSIAVKYQNEVEGFIKLSKERIEYLEDIKKTYEKLLVNESMTELRELWLLAIEDTNARIKLYEITIEILNSYKVKILEVRNNNEAEKIVKESRDLYYTSYNNEKPLTEKMLDKTADILFAKGDYLFGDLFGDE